MIAPRAGLLVGLASFLAGCQRRPPEPEFEPQPASAWTDVAERTWQLPSPVGEPMSIGGVEAWGPALVVSQAPLTVKLGDSPACLCRETVTADSFRMFVHHTVAADSGPLRFVAEIRNLAPAPITLLAGPNSLGLPDPPADEAWIGEPAEAIGWQAMRAYLDDLGRDAPARKLTSLGPEPYRLEATVAPGQTWSWLADFRRQGTPEEGSPTLQVTIAVHRLGRELPALETLPLLAAGDDPAACRGQFAQGNLRLLARAPMDDKPHWLDLGGPALGSDGPGLPGEYAGPPARHPGNVGVLYNVEVELENLSLAPQTSHLLLSAAGGPGGLGVGEFQAGQQTAAPAGEWSDLRRYETVLLGDQEAIPHSTQRVWFTWSLPGGVRGPQRVYAWPDTILPPG